MPWFDFWRRTVRPVGSKTSLTADGDVNDELMCLIAEVGVGGPRLGSFAIGFVARIGVVRGDDVVDIAAGVGDVTRSHELDCRLRQLVAA